MKVNLKQIPYLTIILLVAANLFPLWNVLFYGWQFIDIFISYVAETLILLFIFQKKIKRSERVVAKSKPERRDSSKQGGWAEIFYFFYFFTLLMAGFTFSLFGGAATEKIHLDRILYIVFLFLIIHTISYIANFLGKKEYEKAKAMKLMGECVIRVTVIGVLAIIGSAITAINIMKDEMTSIDCKVGLLPAMVLAKIILDIILHVQEHATLE
ncbi:MAG: DUF6498-containing protein [Candidatus Omnitrophica bacterium]|nr:DUF6498-containing protein [Candidatus Omnitrophota bacterium]